MPLVDRRTVVLTARARRELFSLEERFASQIADDLRLLETPPWPLGKVKKLHGCDFWEIKCGDFRAIFWPRGKEVAVLRIVNRRDLRRALGGIDEKSVERRLEERGEG